MKYGRGLRPPSRSSGRGWRWWIFRVALPPTLMLVFLLQPLFYFLVHRGSQQGAASAQGDSARSAELLSWDARIQDLDERRGNRQVDAWSQGKSVQQLDSQVQPKVDKAEISSKFDHPSFAKPEVAVGWPPSNLLSIQMLEFNRQGRWIPAGQGPVNISRLAPDAIPIVLYVHNRPSYLRVVLDALSHVHGIEETVLIVSHDGYYPEVADIVGEITFTRVKQIFAPYSPHNFVDSFPNISPGDCPERPAAGEVQVGCVGDADQYGNYRAPRIVSLKHHWFWLMNHVWDEMVELRDFEGHIMFMEEDHVLAPKAYRTLQVLAKVKGERCPHCVAVNLGMPLHDGGNPGGNYFVADWMANMGYAFNRSTWQRMRDGARTFCTYSDYNWDETLKWSVMAHWAPVRLGLHAAGPPIMHMGKCGLHGQADGAGCAEIDDQVAAFLAQEADRPPPDESWGIREEGQDLNRIGFSGWGGWGDRRDHKLCMFFAKLPEGLRS